MEMEFCPTYTINDSFPTYNFGRAVDLFGDYKPRKLVRECHVREAE